MWITVLGTLLGNYRVVEQLGVGGMGVVYVGRHEQLGRHVVVKVLRPEMSRKADMAKRFFNEAQAATAIRHPGIAQVFDFGTTSDGRVYFVMELLEGESLTARLAQRRLDYAECCRIGRQIANVLQAAHEAGITHRDLKPDNLFLVPDPEVIGGERVKVLDFGIAKLAIEYHAPGVQTRTGLVMGTPSYMSPEQCRGIRNADARSDIYALGCVLFKMACGRAPFVGVGLGDIVGAHLHVPPPDPHSLAPDLPPALAQLILHMLAKQPDARPQTMTEVSQALDEILRSLGGPSARLAPPVPAHTPPPVLPGLPPTAAPARPPAPLSTPSSGLQHARAASAPPVPPSGPQRARTASAPPVPPSGPQHARASTPPSTPPSSPAAPTEDRDTTSLSPTAPTRLDAAPPDMSSSTRPEDRPTTPYPISSSTRLTDLETTPFGQSSSTHGDTTIVDDDVITNVDDGHTTNVEAHGQRPSPVPPHARAPMPLPVAPSGLSPVAPPTRYSAPSAPSPVAASPPYAAPSAPPLAASTPFAAPSAPYPRAGAPFAVPRLSPMSPMHPAMRGASTPAPGFAWQRILVIGGIALAAVVTGIVIALAS